jgi:hypothetical protein
MRTGIVNIGYSQKNSNLLNAQQSFEDTND